MSGPSAQILLRSRFTEAQADGLVQWLKSFAYAVEGEGPDLLAVLAEDDPESGFVPRRRGIEVQIAQFSADQYVYRGMSLDFGISLCRRRDSVQHLKDMEGFELELDIERAERRQVESQIGFEIQDELALYAFCRSSDHHQLLGWLTLLVAERYDGLIDYGGRVAFAARRSLELSKLAAAAGKPYRDPDGWTGAGTVYETYSPGYTGKLTSAHISDTVFLRAYLRHPHFGLV